jgi:4,5-DOPA dioxygenase extradiol
MKRTPVFFIGHGSPMNAIETNPFTQSLSKMRELCPAPAAILVVSAHWMTEGSWITRMKNPKTIHDFYGFPQALFEVQYPAPGSPETADLICQTIVDPQIHPDNEMWGLDHGTWSVLRHIYPKADIPTLQLSLHLEKPAEYHYKLGVALRPLREKNILIVGSGNVVHNLQKIKWGENPEPFPWAIEYDEWIKKNISSRHFEPLVSEYRKSEAGKLSVPTPEHYYPLLYVLGAADGNDRLKYEFEGIQNGSISMRTLSFDS